MPLSETRGDLRSARDILAVRVGFPSVSPSSSMDLVAWVEGYLLSHDIHSHRFYNEDGRKAAIFARVGPDRAGGAVVCGPSDIGQAHQADEYIEVSQLDAG